MDTDDRPVIEVGYGVARGTASHAVGVRAAKRAMSTIKEFIVSAVMVFVATDYDVAAVLEGVRSVVGDAPVFGASTSGAIGGEIHPAAVGVVVLASPYLRVHCGVGTRASQDWRRALCDAVDSPEVRPFVDNPEYREMLRRNGRECFGMLFTPGIVDGCDFRGSEIFEALRERCGGDFPIMGGGATDDRGASNCVFLGQRAYEDSILLAVFETELQFGISLTHGFLPTDKNATATAVEGDEVLTIDGETAVDAYSRLVGIPKEEMVGRHPAHVRGATIGLSEPMGQHTINIVDTITPRGGIRLSRPVSAGVVLTKMDSDAANLVQAGEKGVRVATIRGGIREIALCFVCYCTLRPKILDGFVEQDFAGMREMLAGKPLVGFLSCGEVGVAADGVSRFNTSSLSCLVLGGRLSRMAQVTCENNDLLKELMVQSNILTRTNEDLWREIAEREKVEAALKASEEMYRQLFYGSPAVKLLIDPETGLVLDINQAAADFYGYSAEEMRSIRIHSISMTDSEVLQKFLDSVDAGEKVIRTRHRLRSGELRDVEVMAGHTFMAGQRFFYGTVIDVTARRQAEEELAHSRDRLAVVVDGARAGICEWDIISGRVFYDKRWKEIIGYGDDELTDSIEEWRSRWHPDDAEELDRQMRDFLKGDADKLAAEYRLRHRDGTYRWVHTGGKLVYDQAGEAVCWTGYNIDITGRKQVEEIRAESEKRLRAFGQAIPAVTCIVDEDGRYVEFISCEDKVLGKSRDELVGRMLHEVMPADIASQMVDGIRMALATGKPRQRVYEAEINGRKRIVDVRAAPMDCLVNGKRTIASVAVDMTEWRETERRLQFAYELRRNSDFINDIINKSAVADSQAIARALKFEIDFARPLRCCLLALHKPAAKSDKGDNKATKLQMIKDEVAYLLSRDSRYLVWDCREGIGVLWQENNADESRRLVQDVAAKVAQYDKHLSTAIGVSDVNIGANCLLKGYRQALSAIMAARCESNNKSTVHYFRDLGLFQLLASLDGYDQTGDFVQEKIGKIIDHDHQKGTDYLRTLEEILYSANLREAAEKLFLHHKTVVFRKRRIEKILGGSLDRFEDRLAFAAAVKLYKLNRENNSFGE